MLAIENNIKLDKTAVSEENKRIIETDIGNQQENNIYWLPILLQTNITRCT